MAEVLPIGTNSEASFDALEALQAISTATFVLDTNLNLVFANIAAEQFFLSSSRVLLANGIAGLFADHGSIATHAEQVAQGQNTLTLHQVTIKKAHQEAALNETSFVDLKLAWFNSYNHKPLLLMSIEPTSIEANLNRTGVEHVASLADMLAHEVKNPLSGIRGAAQLLEQNASVDDQKLTQIICNECDRIRNLVESMEHFSDQDILEFAGLNIHHILDHVLGLASAGFAKDINIQTSYDPSLPLVRANQDALVQLLLNLVKNAAESIAMADKQGRGEIIIKTSYYHGGVVSSPEHTSPTPIEISISDNGTGIPQKLLHTLFEPFITRKKVGKGLGLALVKKLTLLHGGHIFAENTNTGAQFRVYLPVAAENPVAPESNSEGEAT